MSPNASTISPSSTKPSSPDCTAASYRAVLTDRRYSFLIRAPVVNTEIIPAPPPSPASNYNTPKKREANDASDSSTPVKRHRDNNDNSIDSPTPAENPIPRAEDWHTPVKRLTEEEHRLYYQAIVGDEVNVEPEEEGEVVPEAPDNDMPIVEAEPLPNLPIPQEVAQVVPEPEEPVPEVEPELEAEADEPAQVVLQMNPAMMHTPEHAPHLPSDRVTWAPQKPTAVRRLGFMLPPPEPLDL